MLFVGLIRRTAGAHPQFSGCSSKINAHSETGQMAVCCQNLPLGELSSRGASSLLVGELFKKFGLFFFNTPCMLKFLVKRILWPPPQGNGFPSKHLLIFATSKGIAFQNTEFFVMYSFELGSFLYSYLSNCIHYFMLSYRISLWLENTERYGLIQDVVPIAIRLQGLKTSWWAHVPLLILDLVSR
jgi:hypothetical protein